MRWWWLVALVATAVECSASAAAGPPQPHSPPSPVPSFHSVRTYMDVAEPVRVPALRVDSPLLPLGVARTIEVPADYRSAGWFADGPRPGQPGPAVILGHVDSKAGPGVFYRLAMLPVGADIQVERADGIP